MECKYTKYTIIEIVPFELKSKKTPLYTIVNSILLWTWLIIYFLYLNISALFDKTKSFKRIYEKKYESKNIPNEEVKSLRSEPLIEEELDHKLWTNPEEFEVVNIQTEEFSNSKIAFKIIEELINNHEITLKNFKKEDIDKIGKFVLRKEIITLNISEEKDFICGKILLVRAISDPVKKFMDFMFKKII